MSYYDLLGVLPGQFVAGQRQAERPIPTSALTDSPATTPVTPKKDITPRETEIQTNTRRQRGNQNFPAQASTVIAKKTATPPKSTQRKLISSLRSTDDPRTAQRIMEENWKNYNDVLRPKEFSVADSPGCVDGQADTARKKVFVQNVLGRTELESCQGTKEMNVLVQWNEMRSNGNRMEWVAEKNVEQMMGGLQGLANWNWNRNPPRTNTPLLPPARKMEGHHSPNESPALPFSSMATTDGLKRSANSSPRSMEASADGANGPEAAGEEYEAARDLMRLKKRRGGSLPKEE